MAGETSQNRGIISVLNRIVEKIGALVISIGGDPADYNCEVYCSTNQAIGAGPTTVAFNTKVSDPANCFNTATYTWTCPVAGWYNISACLLFNIPNLIGQYYFNVMKNGAQIRICDTNQNAASAINYPNPTTSLNTYLEKGDLIRLDAYSAAGKTLLGGRAFCNLGIVKINKYSGGTMTQNLNKFRVYKDSAQTFVAATNTKILFNKKEFDPTNCFDTGANSRFTAQVAGFYQVNAKVRFEHASQTQSDLKIYKNGTLYSEGSQISSASVVSAISLIVSEIIFLNVGDYLEIWAYSSHAAVVQVAAGYEPKFSVHLLSQ